MFHRSLLLFHSATIANVEQSIILSNLDILNFSVVCYVQWVTWIFILLLLILTNLFTWDVATDPKGLAYGCPQAAYASKREDQLSEQALCAEESSATSNRLVAISSILNCLLLFYTLSETRKTASAASESSLAAKRATELGEENLVISRQNAYLDQRPWVYFEHVELQNLRFAVNRNRQELSLGGEILFKISNKGNTSATSLEIRCFCCSMPDTNTLPNKADEIRKYIDEEFLDFDYLGMKMSLMPKQEEIMSRLIDARHRSDEDNFIPYALISVFLVAKYKSTTHGKRCYTIQRFVVHNDSKLKISFMPESDAIWSKYWLKFIQGETDLDI